jgi:hypothetical protein
MATSISVRLDIAARNAYTLRDPVANLGLEPANRARTQWDGSRERTILDLLVHGAACKSCARLNLLASKDRILNCIAHVDRLAVKKNCIASVPLRCRATAVGAQSSAVGVQSSPPQINCRDVFTAMPELGTDHEPCFMVDRFLIGREFF